MSIIAKETWKPIIGYEGLYEVSDYGRVKRLCKYGDYMILTCYKDGRGYRVAGLHKERVRKVFKVHRLVAIHFIPNPENKATVNHFDGIKDNNCIENLDWMTQGENNQHAYDTGLHPIKLGSETSNSKLNNNEVYDIKILLFKKYPCVFIRNMFSISKNGLYAIKAGKTWKHIQLKQINN